MVEAIVKQLHEGTKHDIGWIKGNNAGVVGKLVGLAVNDKGLSLHVQNGSKHYTFQWTMAIGFACEVYSIMYPRRHAA